MIPQGRPNLDGRQNPKGHGKAASSGRFAQARAPQQNIGCAIFQTAPTLSTPVAQRAVSTRDVISHVAALCWERGREYRWKPAFISSGRRTS